MTGRQWLLWAVVLVLGLSSPSGWAACAARHQVALADGTRTCLVEHGVAELRAAGWSSSVGRSIPQAGAYNVAVPTPAERCPAVVGFAASRWLPTQSTPANETPEARARESMQACQQALADAGAPSECRCVMLVADGSSDLPAAAFVALANRRAAPQAAPAVPGAEVLALRKQIESLQAQVGRPTSASADAAARPRMKARALVIGNSRYAHLGTLPNPGNDARAMAARLQRYGIEVDLVLDADRSALVRALGDYQARAASDDVNILFYAGHGLQVDGVNFVVPVDLAASGATAASIKLNAVSLNDALEYLPARTRLVFLDACRDNPLSRSLRATRSGSGTGLAPIDASSGTLVAYATKDGSTAEDGSGGNSPYTAALLQHLDADEDIAIVLRRVRQAVLNATDRRQEPWEYGSLVGDALVLSRLAR